MPEADGATETVGRCDEAMSPDRPLLEGIVIAIARGFSEVSVGQTTLLCTQRGRLRRSRRAATAASSPQWPNRRAPLSSAARARGRGGSRAVSDLPAEGEETPSRIAPGDRVRVMPLGGQQGVVEEVSPRRTVLARSASEDGGAHVMLANADHAALVFAVRDPAPHFGMLDRYLALCEHAGIEVTICLNKVDLGMPPEVEQAERLYAGLGYGVLRTSAVSGEHLAELRERLRSRISLLSGPSGVGKSSLVNVLVPGAAQRTSAVSETTGKGRHTTTGARLLPLQEGGWLADSAGIRELALWNVPPEDLPRCFVELRPVADDCLYEDCEHGTDEAGCALRAALAAGHITPVRFVSFERLLREARGETS
jgi:ribosome biogenesis GTPase / thiamine phosphate phosphatase